MQGRRRQKLRRPEDMEQVTGKFQDAQGHEQNVSGPKGWTLREILHMDSNGLTLPSDETKIQAPPGMNLGSPVDTSGWLIRVTR
jgi:hypothetical protein